MTLHAHNFSIFPALHLRGGRAIDFTEQAPDSVAVVDLPEPVACAEYWIEQGAKWIHVINVDASHDQDASHNWPLIERICQLPVHVQYGGGIRTDEDIRWAMRIGVTRVLISTAAVEKPQLVASAIAEHGSDRFAISIKTDPKGEVVTHGWRTVGGLQAVTLGVQMYHLGITTAVQTRVAEDGSMSGVDLDISKRLAQLTGLNIIVGGEVRDMSDVVACYNQEGVSGILIGKALHTGKINLQRALRATRQKIAFETGLPRWKQEQSSTKARLRYELSTYYLLRHVQSGESLRVLDAGGGNGMDSLRMTSMGHRVDLVDTSLSMLQDHGVLAQQMGLDAAVTHSLDVCDISDHFAESSVDLLLCHNVIQYSDEWEDMLVSMTAPLKKGGIFSLLTRNQHEVPYQIDPIEHETEELLGLLDEFHGESGVFDADITYFTKAFLVNWLEEHGFDCVADYGVFCLHQHPKLTSSNSEPVLFDKFLTLEQGLGERTPYKDTARYLQIIARKR